MLTPLDSESHLAVALPPVMKSAHLCTSLSSVTAPAAGCTYETPTRTTENLETFPDSVVGVFCRCQPR